MTTKKTLNTYSVQGKMTIVVDIQIEAENLQAALTKAEGLSIEDFIEFRGDFVDGDELPRITGLYCSEG